jgi:tripartite-type tricarboxylate transporter receptor subunit TctC
MTSRSLTRLGACVLLALCGLAGLARAETVEEFYRGKQVRLVLGHDVGGDYDLGGRLLGRYLGRYIPGSPTIVVQNMPGANSLVATNFLFNVAPKDGTVIGSFSRNIPGDAVRGLRNLNADPKRFGWIGATSRPGRICIARADSGVGSVKDLLSKELIVGGTGTGGVQSFVPNVVNKVLATKFKVVEGYKGYTDLIVAMERGEISGVCHVTDILMMSMGDAIRAGKYRVLFNVEETSVPDMPEVESIFKYVSNERHRQVLRLLFGSAEFGRPYAAPPDVPADRLAALRAAFDAAAKDPEFLEEAKRLKLDVTPSAGTDLQKLAEQLNAIPKDVIEAANEILPPQR